LEEIEGEAGSGNPSLAPFGSYGPSGHDSEAAPIDGNAVSQPGTLGRHPGIDPQANGSILRFYPTHGSRLFNQSSEHFFSLTGTIQWASIIRQISPRSSQGVRRPWLDLGQPSAA
jgi:hypothetical protein